MVMAHEYKLRLIAEVKKYPPLFTFPRSGKAVLRWYYWILVGQEMGVSADEAKEQWKQIRHYCSSHRGFQPKMIKFDMIELNKALEFLVPHLTQSSRKGNNSGNGSRRNRIRVQNGKNVKKSHENMPDLEMEMLGEDANGYETPTNENFDQNAYDYAQLFEEYTQRLEQTNYGAIYQQLYLQFLFQLNDTTQSLPLNPTAFGNVENHEMDAHAASISEKLERAENEHRYQVFFQNMVSQLQAAMRNYTAPTTDFVDNTMQIAEIQNIGDVNSVYDEHNVESQGMVAQDESEKKSSKNRGFNMERFLD